MSTIVSSEAKQQGMEVAHETEHIENGDWVFTKWFFLKTFLYPVVVRKRKSEKKLELYIIKNYERIKE